jgi:hypothetical protein
MTIQIVPIVVALLGLALFFWEPKPKVSEAGRIMFFAGLLAFLLANAGHSLTIR